MPTKNTILVTIDTLRRDVLECYGAGESRMPFLDSIQDHCIRFDTAKAAGPYTQASFPALLTSSYFLEYGKQKKLPPQKVLISEVLKKNGIKTAGFHSNTYLSYYFGYNRGWDMFYDSMQDDVTDYYPFIRGNGINKKVGTWLDSYVKKTDYGPFFLWVHYMDVHEPYIPDEEFINRVDPSLSLTKEQMFSLFKEVVLPRDVTDPDTVRTLRSLYDAGVLETDSYLKELFSIFDQLGVLDDSTVIITSDHGDEFGEHGGLSHDGKMYGELIDVPLFIYDSDRQKNRSVQTLADGADIPPTICTLFGVENPAGFRGKSLYPLESFDRSSVYGEAMDKSGHKEKESDQPVYYYLESGKKCVYRERDKSVELYDLTSDPGEQNNLAGENPDTDRYRSQLLETMKKYKA